MLSFRYLTLPFILISIYFSVLSLPLNQLTVHKGAAKLYKILTDQSFSFSLVHLIISQPKPSAQPYLFIHGHKGSVKQAISMSVYFDTRLELNMYSIDFIEGAVALSYDLLQAEVNFTVQCIKEIQKRHLGKGIIIIGHSYGGVVAAMALKKVEKEAVKGIFSLSSPFNSPVINTDIRIMQSYDDMLSFLKKTDVFLISITGGIRDQTVPARLTKPVSMKNHLHVYSTSIKDLHKEIDHVAMVWGEEFFKVLSKVLEIAPRFSNNRLVKEVKKIFTCDFSLMTDGLANEQILKIVKVQGNEEIKSAKGLKLKDGVYYIFPSDFALDLPKSSSVQSIDLTEIPRFSLLSLFFGTQIELKIGQNLARVIFTSEDFSEPRYPLHLRVLGEGQAQAIIGRCGNEEIVKYNESDFVLYFHEKCEKGPEIWMLGFDQEFEHKIEIWVDWGGTMLSMTRDFRVHIFTAFFYFSLSEMLNKGLCVKNSNGVLGDSIRVHWVVMAVHFLIVSALWRFGNSFRTIGLGLLFDNVIGRDTEYGVLDLSYIILSGLGVKCLFDLIFNLLKALKKFTSKLDKFCLFLIPLLYSFPWPAFSALLLVRPTNTQALKLSFLTSLSVLPQQIGWYISYKEHNINNPDLLVVLPVLFLMTSTSSKFGISADFLLFPVICGLLVHEDLYKTVWIFQAICLYGSVKSLCLKHYLIS